MSVDVDQRTLDHIEQVEVRCDQLEAELRRVRFELNREIRNVEFLYENNPDMQRGLEYQADRLRGILEGRSV